MCMRFILRAKTTTDQRALHYFLLLLCTKHTAHYHSTSQTLFVQHTSGPENIYTAGLRGGSCERARSNYNWPSITSCIAHRSTRAQPSTTTACIMCISRYPPAAAAAQNHQAKYLYLSFTPSPFQPNMRASRRGGGYSTFSNAIRRCLSPCMMRCGSACIYTDLIWIYGCPAVS